MSTGSIEVVSDLFISIYDITVILSEAKDPVRLAKPEMNFIREPQKLPYPVIVEISLRCIFR
jgi:hypothetical protein